MKRFISILSGLLLAAVIGLAQGKWEQASVTPYGTGGINRNGERIDNSYSSGKFNSEVKSTSKNNPYVYFRKGTFTVPAKTYKPGATFTVNMNLTVKRHSGNGTPKGNAGATIVNGKAGQGTAVPTSVKVSGKDASNSKNVTLTIPTHAAAGNNFSIVYSCFDITVVYLYRWVEDKPVATEKPAQVAETPVVAEDPVVTQTIPETDELVLPDDTILPPADSVEAFEEYPIEVDSLTMLLDMGIDPFEAEEEQPEETSLLGKGKKAAKAAKPDVLLSLFGLDLTKKDVILYGIIGGLVLLVLILLLVLLFRKNPAKKAAKEEAKKAAAQAKAAARAEAAEKAAAAKAAAAEKAAAAKAEREAKLAEQKANQEEQRAAAAEKAAELKQKQEAAKAEREAKLAEQKAAQQAKLAEQKAAQEARRAELKAAQEAKMAELQAKKEAAAAAAAAKAAAPKPKPEPKPAAKPEPKPAEAPKPAAKRFCENCGAPLAPDAAFCENCGTKVS